MEETQDNAASVSAVVEGNGQFLTPAVLEAQKPEPGSIEEIVTRELPDVTVTAEEFSVQHDFSRHNGYSLELPSYVPASAVTEQTGQMIEEYSVLARELNILPDAAQQLLETYADASLALPEGLISGANPGETTNILRVIWGSEYDYNLKIVQETARSLGSKFCAWLDRDLGDGRMLSNDAATCQALLAHGKGWTRLSPAQAQASLDKIMKDQKHPYWSGNKNAIAEVKALRQRVSGTAGKASATRPAVKPPAEPSGRQKVEQRIAAIRRDPHYVGSDKALRSVLIAEMQQLQQQLTSMEGRE